MESLYPENSPQSEPGAPDGTVRANEDAGGFSPVLVFARRQILTDAASLKNPSNCAGGDRSSQSSLFSFLSALRYAGNRSGAKLDLALPHSHPVQTDQTPSEIQRLLERLRLAARAGRFDKDGSESAEAETAGKQVLKQLDSRNRLVMELAGGKALFYLRQEMLVQGAWQTIAYYEFRDGSCIRYLNKSNGARRALSVNLPQTIVPEMALKDLSKNWQTYARAYEMIDQKAC